MRYFNCLVFSRLELVRLDVFIAKGSIDPQEELPCLLHDFKMCHKTIIQVKNLLIIVRIQNKIPFYMLILCINFICATKIYI